MSAFDEFEVCRDILESLLTGVCVIDTQKKIVFWSDGAERITGHLRHEVIGRSCIAQPLLHCDHAGCEFCGDDCPLARAMKTSRAVETTGFLHHRSGYEIPVNVRAAPVHNHHGSIIGAVQSFDSLLSEHLNHSDEAESGCIDQTTGIATQARMCSCLCGALEAFSDLQIPFGLLRFRLVGLEQFRPAFGCDAASALLRVVGHSLSTHLMRTGLVGHWAHDEFLAVVNGCREQSLAALRERLRPMLANDFIEWWGERRSLPVGIGDALVQPGDSFESILDRTQKSLDADAAWRIRGANNHTPGS